MTNSNYMSVYKTCNCSLLGYNVVAIHTPEVGVKRINSYNRKSDCSDQKLPLSTSIRRSLLCI